jgi:23S rRNA (adenine2503-C2)-methyltransferase
MFDFDKIEKINDEAENVTKFVFSNKTAVAEAVLYKYPDYQTRTVICCSTQSGCPVGCRFCGAGDNFIRSLTTDEILDQVEHCLDETGVTIQSIDNLQIMFMSMGEPFLNMKNLIPALQTLYARYPKAKLLVSTSAPSVNYDEFYDVASYIPTVGLQFSIHESTDAARDQLIPFKKKLQLWEIAQEGFMFFVRTGRKPFFNYCAHENNSSQEDVDRLFSLFDPYVFNATVSVICERSEGIPASNDYQKSLASDFASKLLNKGYDVRVFDPAGQDTIGGGCGQLWFVQNWMKENPSLVKPSVGFGKFLVHTPGV